MTVIAMQRFKDEVVLVLGGARGIGAACAVRLAAEGAAVCLGDVDTLAASDTAARIRASGGTAQALAYDQGDASSVVALVAQAGAIYGRVDAMLCNAAAVDLGRSGADRPVAALDDKVWEESFRTNVTNHAVATRELLPGMLARGKGAILYIASDWSVMGGPFMPAYATSKAALLPLARQVCLAHGKQGIRANVVSPGLIVTDATREFIAEKPADHGISSNDDIHSPRLGTPEDVAALVAFLLSHEAAYINGQAISINGGAYCRF